MAYLLDTNIVSLALRNNFKVTAEIAQLKSQRQILSISCVTYFEVKRGLFAVKATKQLERFDNFCKDYQIIFLDDLAILEKAAEIHANLRLRGLPIQTEDILIAATAIVKGFILVSHDSDLLRVEELTLENWLEE
ncbi:MULTISPECIES: type II toxin-antitoxin system VapC family toxin [Dolichospermum]|jgi:tRNA(fMet)-specific endonuclease VapC|uniref:type II toxin-antitoxin system VapC family toxin n=1 Tax=Dolichospermum TaxID=748770 RepID=UPI001681A751|nr:MULTISPECIES: type II toxin-antitoxin system VapC family toxin [Dolichospermum]MBD1214429.1 type II toxin-antitoxin system VapC family toxin [Dolichospermum circinale Clear-D4]MBD2445066.1 type II toxin-antitoxin system VapC family toxin [Dolichospermum sp. FACHB-1091]MDB9468453.1 type II toxin-antitoxin system VapC family toxin [Dolichospermum circinale CS-539/09]MDB9471796.1 type II toxin-antitoxin system VapC family toxin [Dolichospermum circinale CS-539]